MVTALNTELTDAQNSSSPKTADEKIKLDDELISIIGKHESQFVEGSSNFTNFATQRKQISDDKKYRKIDEAYAGLNQMNLRQVAGFLTTWGNVSQYPRYKDQIANLSGMQKTLTDKIRAQLTSDQGKSPDDQGLSAAARMTACSNRIAACSHAIGQLIDGSREQAEVKREKQSEESLLQSLKDYQGFEDRAKALLDSRETGKIRRIEAFLKEPRGSEYKEGYNGELTRQLVACQSNQIDRVRTTLDATLKQNAEDLSLPAPEIIRRAQNRVDAYQKARDEFVETTQWWKDADGGLRTSQASLTEWNRYKQFDEDFKGIQYASENLKLKKIDQFLKKYDERKLYSRRAAKYSALTNMQQELEKNFQTACDAEFKKLVEPGKKDFSAWIDYYRKQSEIVDKYCAYYPTNSLAYQNLLGQRKLSDGEREKYVKWHDLHNRADQINRTGSNEVARLVLPLTIKFFKDFPKNQYTAAEVADDIKMVATIQSEKAADVCQELENTLSLVKLEDCPDESSKQKAYYTRCVLIDKELPYLEGTDSYDLYKGQRNDCSTRLDTIKQHQLFDAEYDKLIADCKRLTDPAAKLDRIDGFESDNAQFKSEYSSKFAKLKTLREQYADERDWSEIAKTELVKPDESEVKRLQGYRSECEKLIGKAKPYREKTLLRARVQTQCKKWQEEIDWVAGLIGNGTYSDICEKEKAYKADPTEESFAALCKALKSFDSAKPENFQHKDNVEAIRKSSSTDWKDRSEIVTTWDKLSSAEHDCLRKWQDFKNACDRYFAVQREEYSQRDGLMRYKKLCDRIASPAFYKVEFTGLWEFKLPHFGRITGEKRAKFYMGDTLWFDIKFSTPYSDWGWLPGMKYEHQSKSATLQHPLPLKVGQTLHFRLYCIGNWTNERGKNYDDFHVDVIPALVALADDDCAEFPLKIKGDQGMKIRLTFTRQ